MKKKTNVRSYAFMASQALILFVCSASLKADITVENTNVFVRSASYPIAVVTNFNPGSATKLVATVSTEDGFGDTLHDGITYDSVDMTLAITANNDIQNTWIYYLDASDMPGGTFPVGELVINGSGDNDLGGSLIALAGADAGVAATNAATAASVTLTTEVDGACVVAAHANNDSGATAQPPLTPLLDAEVGSCGGGSGFAIIESAGLVTNNFLSTSRPVTVAAAFVPIPPPAGTVIVIK